MNLLSLENLDRSSPDLWPKTTTDLNDFIAQIKAVNLPFYLLTIDD